MLFKKKIQIILRACRNTRIVSLLRMQKSQEPTQKGIPAHVGMTISIVILIQQPIKKIIESK